MTMNDEHERGLMIAVFSVSAGMVGVCLTGIGLLQVVNSVRAISTLADEFLAADAVMFLGCCLLCFLSFRVSHHAIQLKLRKAADALFFIGLLTMVVVCGLITWALA